MEQENDTRWLEKERNGTNIQKRRCYGMWKLSGEKLMDHVMKVLERVVDKRLRESVDIDGMQFGSVHERKWKNICQVDCEADTNR